MLTPPQSINPVPSGSLAGASITTSFAKVVSGPLGPWPRLTAGGVITLGGGSVATLSVQLAAKFHPLGGYVPLLSQQVGASSGHHVVWTTTATGTTDFVLQTSQHAGAIDVQVQVHGDVHGSGTDAAAFVLVGSSP